MKMTIREVMEKLKDIDYAIELAHGQMDSNAFDVVDLLQEYAIKIKDTQVDI